ncbi:immunoglobulin-like domain-containing protein [Poritiphilus flavus]|uniref:DUF5011 domain-containing protein n=1 Tax=Poritiphilus flavus TaxID=2697053 RepID=A0A6L9EIL2_9FLAO|nr:immunoglobulin-like domain-containing protein [Poritiphilus flavus]NAS14348.1 DUF5011 domain-containing protein [Poritiphilus flavus]
MRTKHFMGLKGALLAFFGCFWIITGLHAQNEFITSWETTTANETITIPTTGAGYNYSVDWGDGTTTNGNTGDAVHTYSSVGTHTVKISGNFPRIYFNDTGDKLKLKEINQWGNIAWGSMDRAFWGCANLEVKATDVPDLSSVENMDTMFFDCTSLTGDASFSNWNWDTSNVKNMVSTFRRASAFNGDIRSWNTSNVVNMVGTFWEASAFNQDIGSWNTSKVDNMNVLLMDASSFDQNLGNWDLTGLNAGNNMLSGSGLSINNWDNTLSGWHGQGFTNTISIGATGLVYCTAGTKRAELSFNITGDILSDTPLTALCQQTVTLQLDTDGKATLKSDLVDNGSDACGMSLSLSQSDFTTVSTSTVTLTVTNGNNNTATCTTTVNVVDNIPPVITLLGDDPLTLELGEPYVDPGVSAADNVDGDISADVIADSSNVDNNTVGEYTVTYDVADAAGNDAAQVTRTVRVIDPPVDITAFSFAEQLGIATIDVVNHTVELDVVNGADLANLVATFTVSDGTSVTVNNSVQESGITSNDFTSPVDYKVISPKGYVEQLWTVTVTESPRPFVYITPGMVSEPFEFVGGNVQGTFPITITFSTDVNGFEESDVQVTNAELLEFQSEDPTTYTSWVRPTGGDITISVPENVAIDDAGVYQNLANSISVGYDTSLNISITGPSHINSQDEITLEIRFATGVTGFDLSDIQYSETTSLNNFIEISSSVYEVDMEAPTVNGEAIDGTVAQIWIPPHVATATDQSKRNMPATFTLTYDVTPPEITLVLPDLSEDASAGKIQYAEESYVLVTANETLANLNSDLDGSFVNVEKCLFGDYFEGEIYLEGLQAYVHGDIAKIQLLAGAFTDLAGNSSLASNTLELVYDYDVNEPNFFPVDDGIDIDPLENLTLTFDENIYAGRGYIKIYRADDDDSPVLEIDVEVQQQRVSFDGNTVTIDPGSDLAYDTDYYLHIGPEVIQDIYGNEYDGIQDNSSWNFRTKAAPDISAPVIELLGENPVYLTVGDTYVEAGATATDDRDGDLSSDIVIGGDTVDTSIADTYEVTYDVSDGAGNAATQVVREVVVRVPDTTAPVITLLGDNPMYVTLGDTYVEPGATATDDIDGDLSSDIVIGGDTVNTAVLGTYELTYDVSDAAGNAADQKTRVVIVEEACAIAELDANNFQILVSDETCSGKENGSIQIQATAELDYTISIADTDYSFRSQLLVDELAPGTYTFCIGLEGAPDCEQCFEATVAEGTTLEGTTSVVRNGTAKARMSVAMLSGTTPFKVSVNGYHQATYSTPDFTVDVADGDQVEVTSSLPCEGTLSIPVELPGQVSAFPNPVSSELTVTLPSNMGRCTLSVHQMNGAVVFQEEYDASSGNVQISLAGLPSGMYLVKVQGSKEPITLKIIKE